MPEGRGASEVISMRAQIFIADREDHTKREVLHSRVYHFSRFSVNKLAKARRRIDGSAINLEQFSLERYLYFYDGLHAPPGSIKLSV